MWGEALRCATSETRVRLGGLEVDLTELVPALRLKQSRSLPELGVGSCEAAQAEVWVG